MKHKHHHYGNGSSACGRVPGARELLDRHGAHMNRWIPYRPGRGPLPHHYYLLLLWHTRSDNCHVSSCQGWVSMEIMGMRLKWVSWRPVSPPCAVKMFLRTRLVVMRAREEVLGVGEFKEVANWENGIGQPCECMISAMRSSTALFNAKRSSSKYPLGYSVMPPILWVPLISIRKFARQRWKTRS